jgi:type I restriction enzyme S subunit
MNTLTHIPWPDVRIGDVLTYLDERVDLDDGAEYLTITVKRRHGGLEERERIAGHQIQTKKQSRLIPGAFIISRVQCWHQAYAIVPDDIPPNMIASINYDQFAISSKVDRRFFWWLSHSPYFTETVRSSAFGVVIEKMVFNRGAWLEKQIPLPPFEEQRRIATRIEALAAKIHEASVLCRLAEEEMEALVVSTHLSLAGLRTRKVAEILTLDECEVVITPIEGYPQVGIKSFGGGLFSKPSIPGGDTTYRTFNRLYEGAVILSQVKGWEGAVAVCGSDLSGRFVSPEYRTFRCIPSEARPDYLAAVVRTEWFWGRLKNATRGVGARRERTRPEQFLALEIPMPDVGQQQAAELIFSQIRLLKSLQTETSAELEALMPSILDKAFRGEL